MQKKLIALAIAGLASSAAFAQSNVQIYGVADAYVGSFSTSNTAAASGNTHRAVNSGGLAGSRLGFKGVEDLGNGLKALFTLEYALAIDDADSIGAARQEFVGLTGGFGTAVMGRLQTPGYDWAVKYAALGGTAINPAAQVQSAIGAGINQADRVNNAIAYVSPSLAGVTLKVAHSSAVETKTVDGDVQDERGAYLLSADYDNGPLSVGLVYRNLEDSHTGGRTFGQKEWGVGAKYAFSFATLFANYQTLSLNADQNDGGDAWNLGVAVPVSAAGTVVASYANSKLNADDGVDTEFGATSWTLAYTHALSKRTTAYAGITHAAARSEGAVAGASFYGLANLLEDGERVRGVVAGLNHKF